MNTIIEAPMKKIPPILIRAKYKSVGSPFFTEKIFSIFQRTSGLNSIEKPSTSKTTSQIPSIVNPLHNFKLISLFALPNFFASIHAL